MRRIAFCTITTNKIRVVVRRSLSGYRKIVEIKLSMSGRSKATAGSSFDFRTNASDKEERIHKYVVDFGDGTPRYERECGYKPAMKELKLTHTTRTLKLDN